MESNKNSLSGIPKKNEEKTEALSQQLTTTPLDMNQTGCQNALQNEQIIQIDISNEPTQLDYITAYSTLGAVLISVLLGVIFPFLSALKKIWKNRIRLKLKFIEYSYDKGTGKPPIFHLHFQNMYEHPLYIKNILLFIKFKTHVLPIILRLCNKKDLLLSQLSEEKMDLYIANNYSTVKKQPLKNEQEILDFINQDRERCNKVSPYDKIKSVYLFIETNTGQIKINVPKWMRDFSSDEIIGLYLKDVFISPKGKDLKKYMHEVSQRYKKGANNRKKELWNWKIEKFFCLIPLDTLYANFKRKIGRLKRK
ncbi:MAG: hypothetical protein ILP11_04850 [Alphaproteobacteria bacterium]|nr:hypothetical protein [Alphaproteobacteria bacterium]